MLRLIKRWLFRLKPTPAEKLAARLPRSDA
jgi:hypothetical protein